jgi:hypothetical protein
LKRALARKRLVFTIGPTGAYYSARLICDHPSRDVVALTPDVVALKLLLLPNVLSEFPAQRPAFLAVSVLAPFLLLYPFS